jgi:polysaccharide export outer membrane protein
MESYRLRPGDKIIVDFFFEPELSVEATIRPDGYVALPLVGDIQASSRTPAELDEELTEAYSRYVKQPEIAVMVSNLSTIEVYVGGEVQSAGRVEFTPGMRASQAIIVRGGFNRFAAKDDVVLLRQVADGTVLGRRIDLSGLETEDGAEDDLLLKPNDVIMIPPTNIAKVGRFVDAYIGQVFAPVSASVSQVYSTIWFQEQLEK